MDNFQSQPGQSAGKAIGQIVSLVSLGYLLWMGLGDVKRRLIASRVKFEAKRAERELKQFAEPAWYSELREYSRDIRDEK